MRRFRARRWWLAVSGALLLVLLAGGTAAALPYWRIENVDQSGLVGTYTSLALDSSGNPHISYIDFGNGDLKYASWDGTGWQFTTVDHVGNVESAGADTYLRLGAQDNPHISYYDAANGDLKYAAWDGSSWQITAVDSGGDVGRYASLALDTQGHPHISYLDYSNFDLKYAWWDGSSWQAETVDSGGNVGIGTSLALDSSGNPRIAYYDVSNVQLKYTWWDGTDWQIEVVDSDATVGWYPSLALDASSNPHIGYYDVSRETLKYASWDGTTWQKETVDSDGNVGMYLSMVLDSDGNPHFSYFLRILNPSNGHLKYAWWNGSSWQTETVDSNSDVGWYTSLALDGDGNAHISYFDSTNQQLKYASLADDSAAPTTTATATTTDTNAYAFGTWTNQHVSVTLSADDDDGSGVASTYYTLNGGSQQTYSGTPISITEEGTTTLDYWSTDLVDNAETHHSVTIMIDLTNPTATGAATTAPNGAGWYNTPVTIHWTCDDSGGSGLAACPEDQTIHTEGQNQTITGTVTDNAGNSVTATSDAINIDLTNPTITYTGNEGTYTVDQTIDITCAASDNLSGIASTDCADITGPAFDFAAGPNTYTNTATDNAGNVGSNSVSFTVEVTYDSLCHLTEQYASNARTASRLCIPLNLAKLGQQIHSPGIERAGINTFILLANTQRGRGLTNSEADTLIRLVQSLQ